MNKQLIDKNNSVGITGEYFVMAELTRRGYIASLTSKNTKTVDLLVSNKDGSKFASIQVKTSTRKKSWILSDKNEKEFNDYLFYVFVKLELLNDGHPQYFIVPSGIVADYIKKKHSDWLGTTGRQGQKHENNSIRNFGADVAQGYENRWDLLSLD